MDYKYFTQAKNLYDLILVSNDIPNTIKQDLDIFKKTNNDDLPSYVDFVKGLLLNTLWNTGDDEIKKKCVDGRIELGNYIEPIKKNECKTCGCRRVLPIKKN